MAPLLWANGAHISSVRQDAEALRANVTSQLPVPAPEDVSHHLVVPSNLTFAVLIASLNEFLSNSIQRLSTTAVQLDDETGNLHFQPTREKPAADNLVTKGRVVETVVVSRPAPPLGLTDTPIPELVQNELL